METIIKAPTEPCVFLVKVVHGFIGCGVIVTDALPHFLQIKQNNTSVEALVKSVILETLIKGNISTIGLFSHPIASYVRDTHQFLGSCEKCHFRHIIEMEHFYN